MIYDIRELEEKGIIVRAALFDYDISPACRTWLDEQFDRNVWWWDYFIEEHEIGFYFTSDKDAMLFKLRWL